MDRTFFHRSRVMVFLHCVILVGLRIPNDGLAGEISLRFRSRMVLGLGHATINSLHGEPLGPKSSLRPGFRLFPVRAEQVRSSCVPSVLARIPRYWYSLVTRREEHRENPLVNPTLYSYPLVVQTFYPFITD